MIILPKHDKRRNQQPAFPFRLAAAFIAALITLALAGAAHAQVAPTASSGGFGLSVGATGSGEYVQYGERKMVGVTGFVDFDTQRNLGVEGEARFVQFLQTDKLYFSTYSAGVRYRRNFGRLQPYVKGLIGRVISIFPTTWRPDTTWWLRRAAGLTTTWAIAASTSARLTPSGSTGPGSPSAPRPLP